MQRHMTMINMGWLLEAWTAFISGTIFFFIPAPLAAALWLLVVVLAAAFLLLLTKCLHGNPPPAVPGLPLLGNLLQLGEKLPLKSLSAWGDKYGPIYTIKAGANTMVVISSPEIAKEAMVTKYSSISTRKMSKALFILSAQKTMVAMSDYGDVDYHMLKKLMVTNLLAAIPQKANRHLHERSSRQMIDSMYKELSKYPGSKGLLNIRVYLKNALFPSSMYQVLGRDPEFVFVKEFGRNVSRREMYQALVMDILQAVIEVDWRDFFPPLKWLPNKALEDKVNAVSRKREAIVNALIAEQRQLLANGKKPDCFLDILLTQATHLTEKQLLILTWEPIIESTDTTLVTLEWAMYEIAKNPAVQERLYKEISEVAGSRIVTEDDLPKFQYLHAIVKETLRKYPAVPLLVPRHVDEDVKLGGFDIKKGWEIIINVFGINHNKEVWNKPEEWDPERVLGDEKMDLGFKDYRALPFGAGKRMCAGVTQAMYIIPIYIAYCVQHFKWTLPPEDTSKAALDSVSLTNHKLYPLEAIASPRFASRLPDPSTP